MPAELGVAISIVSHKVMGIELVVPTCLIVGVFHVQSIVVDAIVMPFTTFIEHVHLLAVNIGVDHVQVQALMLLEERSPRGRAPIVVPRDWDHLVHWNVNGLNTAEFQCVESQELGFRIELHSQDKAFRSKCRFDQEWEHGVYFGFVVS